MKPFNLTRWQRWLLDWQERLRLAALVSGWEDEDLGPPSVPEPSGWSREAQSVLDELEEMG
ncbi:MAG: hypothetical protein SFU83_12205 [Meiothermus sp.]|nr:hypothetical protein [Meiothermus sp.]